MDIMSVIRDEAERDLFFIQEEMRDMEQSVIRQFQDEAEQAYIRLPQPEAAHVAQVAMLAEIALQLAKMNEHLAKFNEYAEHIDTIMEVR
jgi:hypothetical protein